VNRPVALSLRLYRAFAKAFPHEFKNVYGQELERTAEDAVEPMWQLYGVPGLFRFLLDIALGIVREHLAELRQDVRFGLRTLARSPGFTSVALASLSLGICIATSAYSELHGLILRDVPGVSHPDELIAVQMPTSYPNCKRYSERTDLFSSTLAYIAPAPFDVSIGGHTNRIWGHLVTRSYFSALGVNPAWGRFFGKEDEITHKLSIVLSYRFWQNYLDSDRLIIGRSLRVNGHDCTIAGITPREFLGASPMMYGADLWMPAWVDEHVAPELADRVLERPELTTFHFAARLRSGVTTAEAEAVLDSIARRVEQDYGGMHRDEKRRRVVLVPGGKELPVRKQDLPFLTEFFTVLGGTVLLIACANLANMLLARATDRRKEIAVRLSLGASRSRLMRQLLTESLLLAIGAGVLGFCLSMWVMRGASQIRMPYPVPVTFDLNPDLGALVFTFSLSVVVGLTFGLLPAWRATRHDLAPALKEGGDVRIGRFRRLNLRSVLVVSQVAGSLALLLLTGFLVLGSKSTLGTTVGFDPKNIYLMALDPIRDGRDAEATRIFFKNLLDRVHALPSVAAATLTDSVPLAINGDTGVRFSGPAKEVHTADRYVVGRDYFETLGIPVSAGRTFRKEDEGEGAAAVIVSEELVRRFWNGREPLSQFIEISNGALDPPAGVWPGTIDHRDRLPRDRHQIFQVVGVVKDVAHGFGIAKPPPAVYFPLRAGDYARPSFRGMTLIVRALPGADALGAIRRQVSALDAGVTPFNIRTMEEQIGQTLFAVRSALWTYGVIGIVGLILASIGLAGVTAYSVAQRIREIGIRMALGAQKMDVLRLVMTDGAILIAAGSVIGLVVGWAALRVLRAIFSTVGQSSAAVDYGPALVMATPLLLASLALAACYVPARRSMHVDPAVALRQE
jgi:predicted permease